MALKRELAADFSAPGGRAGGNPPPGGEELERRARAALVWREMEIAAGRRDQETLRVQSEGLIAAGRPRQAARHLRPMMRAAAGELERTLAREGGTGPLLITRHPESHAAAGRFRAVLGFSSEREFMEKELFRAVLHLRRPEVTGIVIEEPGLIDSPDLWQALLVLAHREGKQIRLAGASERALEIVETVLASHLDQQRARTREFPAELNIIDSIGNCNLKCRMCPQATHTYRPQVIAPDLFARVIDGVPAGFGGKLSLTGFSEPLLTPGLVERLAYVGRRLPRAQTQLNTNGTLLTLGMARALVETGLKNICFSLNMHTREDYAWFSGRDLFLQACRAVILMRQTREAMSSPTPRIFVQLLNIRRNRAHHEAFRRCWGEVADGIMLRDLSNWAGEVDIDREVAGESHGGGPSRPAEPCISLHQSLAVNWRGEVYPCCLAACREDGSPGLLLGNASRDDLASIWTGDNLRQIRTRQLLDLEPACERCTHYLEAGEDATLMLKAAIDRSYQAVGRQAPA